MLYPVNFSDAKLQLLFFHHQNPLIYFIENILASVSEWIMAYVPLTYACRCHQDGILASDWEQFLKVHLWKNKTLQCCHISKELFIL